MVFQTIKLGGDGIFSNALILGRGLFYDPENVSGGTHSVKLLYPWL
jgi:hypothetical protein